MVGLFEGGVIFEITVIGFTDLLPWSLICCDGTQVAVQ